MPRSSSSLEICRLPPGKTRSSGVLPCVWDSLARVRLGKGSGRLHLSGAAKCTRPCLPFAQLCPPPLLHDPQGFLFPKQALATVGSMSIAVITLMLFWGLAQAADVALVETPCGIMESGKVGW
jgi:hypothetical protein